MEDQSLGQWNSHPMIYESKVSPQLLSVPGQTSLNLEKDLLCQDEADLLEESVPWAPGPWRDPGSSTSHSLGLLLP